MFLLLFFFYFFLFRCFHKTNIQIQVIFNNSGCNKIKILAEPLKKCMFLLLLFLFIYFIHVTSENKNKIQIQVIFNHPGCNKIKILAKPVLLLFIYLFYSGAFTK